MNPTSISRIAAYAAVGLILGLGLGGLVDSGSAHWGAIASGVGGAVLASAVGYLRR